MRTSQGGASVPIPRLAVATHSTGPVRWAAVSPTRRGRSWRS